MYKIKYIYDTGDSFGKSPGKVGFLENQERKIIVWKDLDEAKLALTRMKEHYLWQDSLSSTYSDDLPKPGWWTGKFDPRKYTTDRLYFNTYLDGVEIRVRASTYLGYFESLVSAEIISDNSDMKFEI